jgi:hypothetical protein
VERFPGRGKARADRALQLVRPGAESRPESLLRLAILATGLPEPELNVEVYSSSGIFVGGADLLYRRYRLVIEYDGDHHRVDSAQFDRDIGRLDDFAAAGWRVVRIAKRSFLGDRDACTGRVRRAMTDAGWRPEVKIGGASSARGWSVAACSCTGSTRTRSTAATWTR